MNAFLSVCHHLFVISEIPVCILKGNEPILCLPETEAGVFSPEFINICMTDYSIFCEKNKGPMSIMLNPGYYLSVARLYEDTILILGPGVLARYSWKDIAPWINAPLYKDNSKIMGQLLMRQNPTTTSQFFHTLSMYIYMASRNLQNPYEYPVVECINITQSVQPSLTQYMFDAKESEGFHTPLSLEVQISTAIESGNISMLKNILRQPIHGRIGMLSRNPDRQQRYMFVTISAVVNRAAIRAGLDHELAYSMADIYCQKMDMMTNPNDIAVLQMKMVEDFCQKVANLKTGNYSPVVKSCISYIQEHSHEKIVLDELSIYCGMSSRRLSEKFKSEVGISVVDYIHKVKLEEAELLLRHSNYSLGEISNYLGYANQSYFIDMFRKFYNMTPAQYRKGGTIL